MRYLTETQIEDLASIGITGVTTVEGVLLNNVYLASRNQNSSSDSRYKQCGVCGTHAISLWNFHLGERLSTGHCTSCYNKNVNHSDDRIYLTSHEAWGSGEIQPRIEVTKYDKSPLI